MKKLITLLLLVYISTSITAQTITKDTLIKTGVLTVDETWSGVIRVEGALIIPQGITLTIKPGTVCLMKADRNYQSFDKGSIDVVQGTLKAIGKPDSMIWFTSDHPAPLNGDWGGISISQSYDTEFNYTIVEFAELGVAQFDSRAIIRNSIIRWNNSEGLYCEQSKTLFENNTLYKNAYHEIALENFNDTIFMSNNKFGAGHVAIILQQSNGIIVKNYIHDYDLGITVEINSWAQIDSNRFANGFYPIQVSNSNVDSSGNDYGSGTVPIPVFDYQDTVNHSISYIPGDTNDLYSYVYDQVDQTRRYLKRYGKGLGFGWSLGYYGGYVWKYGGDSLYRIDTANGNIKGYKNSPLIGGSGGMTHDGQFFWTYDKDSRRISKFEILSDTVHVLLSFASPDSSIGNRGLGLTTDGNFLYQKSSIDPLVYKIDMNGNVVGTIDFSGQAYMPNDLIVWRDGYFWGPGGYAGVGKWSIDGDYIGSFYPVANGMWAMCSDGYYFYALHRTCELWNDNKIFKVEPLTLIGAGMEENIMNDNSLAINIYPNPSTGNYTLQFAGNGSGIAEFTVFNILNEEVYSEKLKTTAGTNHANIDLSGLSDGIYVLRAKIDENLYFAKIIKQ